MSYEDPNYMPPLPVNGCTWFHRNAPEILSEDRQRLEDGKEKLDYWTIIEMWNDLDDARKKFYFDLASLDKERFEREMLDWKSRNPYVKECDIRLTCY